MSWSYEEIERDWLGESVIAVPAEEVVSAFQRCEKLLGREWINRSRGTATGADVTLHVVTIGQRLASLDGVVGREKLIEDFAKGKLRAAAELHAVHLLRSTGKTEAELFPPVIAGGQGKEGKKEPDFRIRAGDDPWVYVEVTQMNVAETHDRALNILSKLSTIIDSIARPFDLEVFLRDEPDDTEVDQALNAILSFCAASAAGREELPGGLGLLLLSESPSGPFVYDDHGEERRPRLSQARWKIEQGVLTRRIVVRLPYSDKRAQKKLSREAAPVTFGKSRTGDGAHRQCTRSLQFMGASDTALLPGRPLYLGGGRVSVFRGYSLDRAWFFAAVTD